MTTLSAKNQPPESKSACALCSKPASLTCARCRLDQYCDAACQRAAWTDHKGPCRRAGALRALPDVPPDLPAEVRALAAEGLTEVFRSHKGRGLRALAPIRRGTVVAYVAGPRYVNDSVVPTMRTFEYLLAGIAGDVATGVLCLPDAVNGSLINDPMTEKTYNALTQGELRDALAAYCGEDIRRLNAEADEPKKGNTAKVRTVRDVDAGEELLITYGPYYWLQMLAGKRLAGTTFRAALAANQFILRGDTDCYNSLLKAVKFHDAPREKQAVLLDKLFGASGAVFPLWLKWEGVGMAYCGAVGSSFQGFRPPPGAVNIYMRAPWNGARKETAREQDDLAIHAVIRLARGLLPLAVSASERRYACDVVRQMLCELPGIDPTLIKRLPEAIALHGLADAILDAMDGKAPAAALHGLADAILDAMDGKAPAAALHGLAGTTLDEVAGRSPAAAPTAAGAGDE